jgi:DNA-binding transcriptional LysR family regulator
MYEWAEFRNIQYLHTILKLKGFRAAAEQLHITQPNLSLQARQFQEQASVHLYKKTANGHFELTNVGVAFAFMAKHLLEARDEMFQTLMALEHGDITSVRFGCSPLAEQSLFDEFCQMHRELLPDCPIHLQQSDTIELIEAVIAGDIDAAIVTLPLENPALRIEEIHRDRLVVCLRQDDPLASKKALEPADLEGRLTIFYHPQHHPAAHRKLLEMLGTEGVHVEDFSRASHPTAMQRMVKGGYGVALLQEGTILESELTTRPINGVDWTVDTVVIYHQQHHPKTIPVLVRHFTDKLRKAEKRPASVSRKLPPASENDDQFNSHSSRDTTPDEWGDK